MEVVLANIKGSGVRRNAWHDGQTSRDAKHRSAAILQRASCYLGGQWKASKIKLDLWTYGKHHDDDDDDDDDEEEEEEEEEDFIRTGRPNLP